MTTSFDGEARQLAAEACDLIEARLNDFTTRPDLLNRQLSAGFLARCLALLRGTAALGEAGLDDVCSVLGRVLLEACLLGLYVLLGGHEALTELMGDYQRNVRILADRNNSAEIQELIAGWDLEPERLQVEGIARKLGPLLEATGDQNADPTGLYDGVYRGHSTFGVHGLGAVVPYLELDGGTTSRVLIHPEPGGMTASVHLILGALYTMYFARLAFEQWGYSSETAADLLARVAQVADLHAPVSPARRGNS